MSFQLDDSYVDVPARIREFRQKYPEGDLQPIDHPSPFHGIITIGGQTFVAYTACAYRTPDDPKPGIGCAWEPVPGLTPYTRNSELQNAETSAWGRAIVAALAADAKKIATSDDVQRRQAEADIPPPPVTDRVWSEDWSRRVEEADSLGILKGLWGEMVTQDKARKLTAEDAEPLIAQWKARKDDVTRAAESAEPAEVPA